MAALSTGGSDPTVGVLPSWLCCGLGTGAWCQPLHELNSWLAVAMSTSHCAWSRAGLRAPPLPHPTTGSCQQQHPDTSPSKSLLVTDTKTHLCGLFPKNRPRRHCWGRKQACPTNRVRGGRERPGQKSSFQLWGGILGIYLANNTQVRQCVNKAGSAALPVLAFFKCLPHARH